MALGGGTFTSQNKELPGAYINFVSAASASAALSDRGIATMPLELDWGVEGEVFEVTNEDFQKNSLKLFGYAFDSPKMLGLNDLFMGAKTLYAYRLNGGGDKAANTYATAKYCGVRGNDLKIVIQKNADDASKYDVTTYFGTVKVDTQTVAKAADLVANDYVTFKVADLAVTAGTPLTGGTNGTVDGTAHQAYLDKIESYTYNTMGVVVTDDVTKKLYVAFNKRLRDELGIKFQLVVYNLAADYMGVISVKNKVTDTGWSEAALVYWVTGAESGCAVNKSCQNKKYDGGFTVDTNYTQNAFNEGFTTFDAFQDGWASDAFNAGAAWGDGIADKVSNFSLSDVFGQTDIPNVGDYTSGFNDAIANSGVGDSIGNIDDNTGKIKDSLDVTEEDLKYLRDIAEQESINRFTTAEVTINQTNNNNVSSDTDLDGFITALDDAMGEAIDEVTNGGTD